MHHAAVNFFAPTTIEGWFYLLASALGIASVLVGFFVALSRWFFSRGSKSFEVVSEHHRTQEAMRAMTDSLEGVRQATLTLAAEFRGYKDFANDNFNEQRLRLNRHEVFITDHEDRIDDIETVLNVNQVDPPVRRAARRAKLIHDTEANENGNSNGK